MFSVAIGFGDPHMITLDGVEYTFNGYGEYHIIHVDGPEFNLQGRMQPLVDQSGNTTKATVYKAFAMKHNNSDIVQVRPFIPKPGINIDSESICPCINIGRNCQGNENMKLPKSRCYRSITISGRINHIITLRKTTNATPNFRDQSLKGLCRLGHMRNRVRLRLICMQLMQPIAGFLVFRHCKSFHNYRNKQLL